jgi:type II secretion system protein H
MTLHGSDERAARTSGAAGFSMTELLVVVAIFGVLTAISAPAFLSSWRASTVRAGAEEMVTVLNQARQLAIKENRPICVTNDGTRVQFHLTACDTPAWTGPGTDSNGFIRLANNVTVASENNVVFGYLGTATANVTYVVTNSGRSMNVTVATSGRVKVGS